MSLELTLKRDYQDSYCTLGYISNGFKSLPTLERAWITAPLDPVTGAPITVAGAKGQSRVPPGRYKLERHSTDAHQNVWALVNPQLEIYHWDVEVPRARRGIARTVVLIHPANVPEELKGCIAPGTTRGKGRVNDSRDAVNQIRTWIGGTLDVWLTISEENLK